MIDNFLGIDFDEFGRRTTEEPPDFSGAENIEDR